MTCPTCERRRALVTRFRLLRLRKGYPDYALATIINVPPGWFNEITNHPELLTLDIAEKLARVLDCSVEDLMPSDNENER